MAKKNPTLKLAKRPCKIGSSINTRTEKHGEEDVPACDIPLAGIMLEAEELGALLGDPGAHKALFAKAKNGAPQEPLFRQLKPFVLRDKFEAEVDITLGIGGELVQLEESVLARLTLDPQVGGLTELSLQVQCAPPVEDMAHLIGFLNSGADVEIAIGSRVEKASRKQGDLGLSFPGRDGPEHPDPDAANAPATH